MHNLIQLTVKHTRVCLTVNCIKLYFTTHWDVPPKD